MSAAALAFVIGAFFALREGYGLRDRPAFVEALQLWSRVLQVTVSEPHISPLANSPRELKRYINMVSSLSHIESPVPVTERIVGHASQPSGAPSASRSAASSKPGHTSSWSATQSPSASVPAASSPVQTPLLLSGNGHEASGRPAITLHWPTALHRAPAQTCNYRPRLGEWIIVYSREKGDEVEQLPGAVRLEARVGELDFEGDPYLVEVTERVLSWLSFERARKCRQLGLN